MTFLSYFIPGLSNFYSSILMQQEVIHFGPVYDLAALQVELEVTVVVVECVEISLQVFDGLDGVVNEVLGVHGAQAFHVRAG